MKIGLGRGRVDVERGTKRDDGEEEEAGDADARRRAADPRDPNSRSFQGQDLRYIPGFSTFVHSVASSRVEMESRRRDAAEDDDDDDWSERASERAIEKEKEVERGGRGRASETAEPR